MINIAERFDVSVDDTGAAKVELAATQNSQNSAAIFDFEPRRSDMTSRRNNVYTGLPLAATQERRIDCPTKVLKTSCRALLILQTGEIARIVARWVEMST